MGKMIAPMFENSPLLLFPLVGLGMFLGVFLLTLVRTYAASPREYEARAALPLDDEEETET